MRFDFAVLALSLMTGAAATAIGDRDAVQYDALGATESHDLYKRRGGGGGGGRGGGGGGSSGGSRGGSGSSGSGSSGSSSSKGGSSGSSNPNTRPNSNVGGTSKSGSGPQPGYGGGRYYGGGAAQPFRAGSRAGAGTGLAAGALLGAGAIAFWPSHWSIYHGGVYPYHYRDEFEFYNKSATPPRNERLPVICGCAKGSECGCDDSGDKSNLKDLIGDGDYKKLNKSVIDVAKDDKGRKTIFLDGTLPNGTTTSDAYGGFGHSGVALGLWPAAAAAFVIVFTS